MNDLPGPLPIDLANAVRLIPGDGVVVHRKPLTVIVAPNGPRDLTAQAVMAAVDELITTGQLSFGPVATALQEFVVDRQPRGVAAVLDISPDPIAFLFDQAAAVGPEESHHGDGRSGWTTVFISGDSVSLVVGSESEYRVVEWSQLWAGAVEGQGAQVPLTRQVDPDNVAPHMADAEQPVPEAEPEPELPGVTTAVYPAGGEAEPTGPLVGALAGEGSDGSASVPVQRLTGEPSPLDPDPVERAGTELVTALDHGPGDDQGGVGSALGAGPGGPWPGPEQSLFAPSGPPDGGAKVPDELDIIGEEVANAVAAANGAGPLSDEIPETGTEIDQSGHPGLVADAREEADEIPDHGAADPEGEPETSHVVEAPSDTTVTPDDRSALAEAPVEGDEATATEPVEFEAETADEANARVEPDDTPTADQAEADTTDDGDTTATEPDNAPTGNAETDTADQPATIDAGAETDTADQPATIDADTPTDEETADQPAAFDAGVETADQPANVDFDAPTAELTADQTPGTDEDVPTDVDAPTDENVGTDEETADQTTDSDEEASSEEYPAAQAEAAEAIDTGDTADLPTGEPAGQAETIEVTDADDEQPELDGPAVEGTDAEASAPEAERGVDADDDAGESDDDPPASPDEEAKADADGEAPESADQLADAVTQDLSSLISGRRPLLGSPAADQADLVEAAVNGGPPLEQVTSAFPAGLSGPIPDLDGPNEDLIEAAQGSISESAWAGDGTSQGALDEQSLLDLPPPSGTPIGGPPPMPTEVNIDPIPAPTPGSASGQPIAGQPPMPGADSHQAALGAPPPQPGTISDRPPGPPPPLPTGAPNPGPPPGPPPPPPTPSPDFAAPPGSTPAAKTPISGPPPIPGDGVANPMDEQQTDGPLEGTPPLPGQGLRLDHGPDDHEPDGHEPNDREPDDREPDDREFNDHEDEPGRRW